MSFCCFLSYSDKEGLLLILKLQRNRHYFRGVKGHKRSFQTLTQVRTLHVLFFISFFYIISSRLLSSSLKHSKTNDSTQSGNTPFWSVISYNIFDTQNNIFQNNSDATVWGCPYNGQFWDSPSAILPQSSKTQRMRCIPVPDNYKSHL